MILLAPFSAAEAAFEDPDGDPEEGGDREGFPPDAAVAELVAFFAF